MREIRLSSELPVSFRDELERIVFFNPDQGRVTIPLLKSIERHGVPAIVEDNGLLRFRMPTFGPVQSLFAFDGTDDAAAPRLAAVALFARESRTTMVLLHVVTHEDYTARGCFANASVTLRLLLALRDLSQRIRGVTILRSEYTRTIRFAVRTGGAKLGEKSKRPKAKTPAPARRIPPAPGGRGARRVALAYT